MSGEEVLAIKVYQLPITSLEPGAKITVKAVGIPQISDDISKPMLITRREELASLKYVPADIVIGINRAYMHTRESAKFGSTSPLECFCLVPCQVCDIRVEYFMFTKPIDLMDLWTSEKMGVSRLSNEMSKLTKIERKETKLIEQSCKLIRKRSEIANP